MMCRQIASLVGPLSAWWDASARCERSGSSLLSFSDVSRVEAARAITPDLSSVISTCSSSAASAVGAATAAGASAFFGAESPAGAALSPPQASAAHKETVSEIVSELVRIGARLNHPQRPATAPDEQIEIEALRPGGRLILITGGRLLMSYKRALGMWVCVGALVGGCSGDDGGDGSASASATITTTAASVSTTMTASASDSMTGTTDNSGSMSASESDSSATDTSASATDTSASATDTSASATDTSASATDTDTAASASATDATTMGTTTGDLPPGICGDGELNDGEECDEGPDNGPMANCGADCLLNPCGDGYVAQHEECDLGGENGPDSGCSEECAILPSACGNQSAEAVLTPRPVDIIILIDNSGSMSAEIKGVESNINKNFAEIINKAGLDYQVIMVSRFGKSSSYQVCIEAPLGGIPLGGCVNPPAQPVNNPGKFYHYSVTVNSVNSWCQALATFDGAVKDVYNFAPNGWQSWLRDDSFKVFIEITDDRVSCSVAGKTYNDANTNAGGLTAATAYDVSLRAKSPLHFGDTIENRNYAWYSLVGVGPNNPPEKAYGPMDPIVTNKCNTAVNVGYGYQHLSNMSGGLRAPLCDTTKYDSIFLGIANSVVADAKLGCEFTIPPPPEGKTLDLDSIDVDYTPDGQDPVMFKKVASPDLCDADSFYLEDGLVKLCPAACMVIQGDKNAKLEVEFTCEPLKPN
jgi:hypothetical protein